jgi:phosphatidate phosphatase APP1
MFKPKHVTVFPTYGYQASDSWVIPVRVWVHKERRIDGLLDDHIRALLTDDEGRVIPTEDEVVRCRECVADFIADSDSGERVVLMDEDGRELHRFPSETDANGLVEGELRLPRDRSGRVTITARVSQGPLKSDAEGKGHVMLLEPNGKSVVSDIDDTIKVSEIPAGKIIVLRNTFLRKYVAAEGMLDRYRGFGDVSFHYVSGSPWQLFRLLHKFLVEDGGFPEGTFHMKSLKTSPLDVVAFMRDLRGLIAGKEYTKEQKIDQISELMRHFPDRTFTLIGDSGELDPEVFTHLREKRGAQVEKIVIRDVVNARELKPARLHGVDEIISAPLITHGKSQFT